ncbi:Membrane-associated, eicosanoid/glutathione metabolism (MAPEG) protein [Phytophthora cinnamomi]|uniref:Membrane-associated, eicosanoid/glutathione metabolism (MAPEG) protein n=1 Tax=Phytophthora cinnamomi TaxID=4785 RepID=UPI00355A9785|nr:Membrane-associated, eicosanoid/glutathione metabolism (MAPEG) protein [Phytophthora cinnamomi]
MVESNVTVYIACTSVLYLKFLLATGVQGGKKFRSGGRPPEDASLSLAKTIGKGRKQTYGLDKTDDEKVLKAREAEHRWTRIVSNDLESIPFALFVFGGGILVGSNPTVHAGAMTVYTVARCLHTYVYAHAMQPHRAICWGVGVLATLVGVGNAVAAIL